MRATESGSASWNGTWKTNIPRRTMARGRIEVFTLPRIAIPRRTDIRLTGAIRYISRFPDSLSQNHWDDMFQRTFVQKAIIAPPMITAALAVGGSPIAR